MKEHPMTSQTPSVTDALERLASSDETEHGITFPNIAFESEEAWCRCGDSWPCSADARSLRALETEL